MRGFKITIFGMITVSLDVCRNYERFCFYCDLTAFEQHSFGHWVTFFGQ